MFGSLLDFAKDVGSNLFTSDAEAAMKIYDHIRANNPGVNPINVEYDDGCVTLKGYAVSAEAREKCILMAGNVKGVEKVVADMLDVDPPKQQKAAPVEAPVDSAAESAPAAETAAPETESRFYTIQKGDTLWKIASEAYGNGARYTEIFEANREVILDPDKIYPGQKIRIP